MILLKQTIRTFENDYQVAVKYTGRINSYCDAQGIGIPRVFYRHPAAQYAITYTDCTPPRLVARTWFKQTDVVYYWSH
jgi:hypothetical protein